MKLQRRILAGLLAAMLLFGMNPRLPVRDGARAEENALRQASSGSLEFAPWTRNEGMVHGTLDGMLTGEPGERYNIWFADDYGIIEGYDPILTLVIDDFGKAELGHYFVPAAALPEGATRFLAIGESEWIDCEIPDGLWVRSQKLYSFGLMSDIHIIGGQDMKTDTSESSPDYLRAVEYFNRHEAAFSIVAGDITSNGHLADYEQYGRIRRSADAPVYHVAGNHDWLNDGAEDRSLYTQYVEPNGELFTIEQDGDIFIFISVMDNRCDLSEESMEFLADELEKYADRRVFIIEHAYVGSVGNAGGMDPYGNRENDDPVFRALLEEYSGAALITGHSHLHFDLQRLDDWANCAWARDGLCHRIHVPSLARPRVNDVETEDVPENTYSDRPGSLGYIVDVYEDYAIFRGVDFEGCEPGEGRLLPNAQYLIPYTPAKQ